MITATFTPTPPISVNPFPLSWNECKQEPGLYESDAGYKHLIFSQNPHPDTKFDPTLDTREGFCDSTTFYKGYYGVMEIDPNGKVTPSRVTSSDPGAATVQRFRKISGTITISV